MVCCLFSCKQLLRAFHGGIWRWTRYCPCPSGAHSYIEGEANDSTSVKGGPGKVQRTQRIKVRGPFVVDGLQEGSLEEVAFRCRAERRVLRHSFSQDLMEWHRGQAGKTLQQNSWGCGLYSGYLEGEADAPTPVLDLDPVPVCPLLLGVGCPLLFTTL